MVFTSSGFSERTATRHSVADQAVCDDFGEDAAGSVFPDDPELVTTWSFPGYPPAEVLGVRSGGGSVAVFVAEGVPDVIRDRIVRELAGRAR